MSLFREKTIVLPASAGNLSFHSYCPKEDLECFRMSRKNFSVTRGFRYRFPWCVEIEDLSSCAILTVGSSEVVHLRDGPMMSLVAPTIRNGGVDCVYVVRRLNDQLLEDVSRHSTSVSRDRTLD